jgi:hypothetical protein
MANSGYYYFTSQALETLENVTKTSKSSSLRSLVDDILISFEKQSSNDNQKYYTATEAKFKKLNNDFDETLIVEDDANVSVMSDGAYVQVWVWTDNTFIKEKKTTRSRKVTS